MLASIECRLLLLCCSGIRNMMERNMTEARSIGLKISNKSSLSEQIKNILLFNYFNRCVPGSIMLYEVESEIVSISKRSLEQVSDDTSFLSLRVGVTHQFKWTKGAFCNYERKGIHFPSLLSIKHFSNDGYCNRN